jgi:hypothetical protein
MKESMLKALEGDRLAWREFRKLSVQLAEVGLKKIHLENNLRALTAEKANLEHELNGPKQPPLAGDRMQVCNQCRVCYTQKVEEVANFYEAKSGIFFRLFLSYEPGTVFCPSKLRSESANGKGLMRCGCSLLQCHASNRFLV